MDALVVCPQLTNYDYYENNNSNSQNGNRIESTVDEKGNGDYQSLRDAIEYLGGFPSLSLDKTITKAYFMVTKNRILRFLSNNNRTLSQKRIDRGSLYMISTIAFRHMNNLSFRRLVQKGGMIATIAAVALGGGIATSCNSATCNTLNKAALLQRADETESGNDSVTTFYDFSDWGLAFIHNNRLKANVWPSDPQTACYSGVDTGKKCYGMTCTLYWSSAECNATAALISTPRCNKNVTDILIHSFHSVFTKEEARIQLLNNNKITTIYSERYNTPLDPQTQYEFGWKIESSDTITVTTATGKHTITVSNTNFVEYIGQYCILEHYNGNGTSQKGMPEFTSFYAYDANGNILLFDNFMQPNGILHTTLNGLPYYQFSTHKNWRVTN